MYSARSYGEILNELQKLSDLEASKIAGTFAFDVFSSNAIEFAKVETELEEAYKNAFANTASVEYLELRCEEAGISRKDATFAIGDLNVYGNGTILQGSIFSTAGKVLFEAVETSEIVGSDTIAIRAVKAGAGGNVAANTVTKIPVNIAGITSCTNLSATFNGYDAESDNSLRERYLFEVRQPCNSGSPANYIKYALEVAGVGTARAQRCWNGPGTVKVVIADDNLQAANDELIKQVALHIEEMRPVGAQVTVVSAKVLPVNISAKIIGTLDKAAFIAACNEYFATMVKNFEFQYFLVDDYEDLTSAGFVSKEIVGGLLISKGGADDYKNLLLNGKFEDIEIGVEEIPTVGEV